MKPLYSDQRIEVAGRMLLDEDIALLDLIVRSSGISREDILSSVRTKKIADARHEFCALLATRGYSSTEIGSVLGRHHTTVLHSIKTHRQRYAPPSMPAPSSSVSCVDECKGWDEVLP